MDDAQNKSSDQTAGGQYDPAVTLTGAGVMDILERVSDALYIIDEQWCLTYLNRKAEQLWGRRRDNLLGKNIWEAFPQVVGTQQLQWVHRDAGAGGVGWRQFDD